MKRCIIFGMLCFFSSAIFSQTPKLYNWYWHNPGFPFGIEHIVLSSDSIFFFSISSESGQCYLAKGKWQIRNKKLYLNGEDSIFAYPKPKLEFIYGDTSDAVTITATDYFQKPFSSLALGLIRPKATSLSDAGYAFADTSGRFQVSKKEYEGFFFLYQFYGTVSREIDSSIQSYRLDPSVKEIRIAIPAPNAAGLDRGLTIMNWRNVYQIKKDGLYFKGKKDFVPYKLD